MTPVTSMTLGDVVAQMDMRSGRALTEHNAGWGALVNYVRDARRDLFIRTHPYSEWAHRQTLTVTNGTAIPNNFIRPTRLVVWETAGIITTNSEARRVDPREWHKVTSPSRSMSFTGATLKNPIYMIWVNAVDGPTWANTNMLMWLYPVNGTGQLDYVASYADADLIESTDLVMVPVLFETLLCDMALLRLLDDVADIQRRKTVWDRVQSELSRYRMSNAAALIGEAINQESAPTPEPARTLSVEGGR